MVIWSTLFAVARAQELQTLTFEGSDPVREWRNWALTNHHLPVSLEDDRPMGLSSVTSTYRIDLSVDDALNPATVVEIANGSALETFESATDSRRTSIRRTTYSTDGVVHANNLLLDEMLDLGAPVEGEDFAGALDRWTEALRATSARMVVVESVPQSDLPCRVDGIATARQHLTRILDCISSTVVWSVTSTESAAWISFALAKNPKDLSFGSMDDLRGWYRVNRGAANDGAVIPPTSGDHALPPSP